MQLYLLLFILCCCKFLKIVADNKDEQFFQSLDKSLDDLLRTKTASNELNEDLRKFYDERNNPEMFCKSCQIIVQHLLDCRKDKECKPSTKDVLKSFCNALSFLTPEICDEYIKIDSDTLLFVVDNSTNLTPAKFCNLRFQSLGCQDPKLNKWTVDIPPKTKQSENQVNCGEEKEEEGSYRILHLSDFHYDPLYKPGSNADCGLDMCCQNGIPANDSVAAGHWSDYHVCDAPWHLVTNVMEHIKDEKFDWVLYTGDIMSHKWWGKDKTVNMHDIKALNDLFKKYYPSSFYPVLGNHESHPEHFYAPNNMGIEKFSTQWLFDFAAEEWATWLPEETMTTVKRGAFYSMMIRPKLRLIAINSNVCFDYNLWIMYNEEDPYDQLKWLIAELLQAEKNGEIVHIIGHVPPGDYDCYHQWTYNLKQIYVRFAHIIAATFNGHSHLDEMKLFLDDKDKVINVAFNGGSLTTFIGNNPNYKIYTLSKKTYQVLDFETYTFNLTQANLNPDKDPNWYKMYSLKSAYGLKGTTYDDWTDLVKRMESDQSLKEKYNQYQYRMSPLSFEQCNNTCLETYFCKLKSTDANTSVRCFYPDLK